MPSDDLDFNSKGHRCPCCGQVFVDVGCEAASCTGSDADCPNCRKAAKQTYYKGFWAYKDEFDAYVAEVRGNIVNPAK